MSTAAPQPTSRPARGRSLASQVAIAGLGLGVLIAGIFFLMARTVDEQRNAARDAARTSRFIAAANLLERYLIDAETGERGYVISGRQGFLEPLDRARRDIPATEAQMRSLAKGDTVATRRTERIVARIDSYLNDWLNPTVAVARRDRARAARLISTGEGKRRVDALRGDFDVLLKKEAADDAARTAEANRRASRALALGVTGILVSVLVFTAFTVYVVRAILVPVRRTAKVAGRIREGDLDARVAGADRAQAELGSMVRGFNAMADTLRANQRALREQNEELEERGDELRAQREELEAYAEELESQRTELESAVAQLEATQRRTRSYEAFSEAVATEGSVEALADVILTRAGDALGADLGALWIAEPQNEGALRLAGTRGVAAEALPAVLDPGVGLAGRAAAERRVVQGSFERSQLRLPAYGREVDIRHELNLPMHQGDNVLGVLTLGRAAGDAWPADQIEFAERIAGRGAASLAKAVALRESRSRLAVTRAVLDATPDAIGLVAPDGRVVLANEPMREWVGRLGTTAVVSEAPEPGEPLRDVVEGPDGRVLDRYVAALGVEDGVPGTLVVLRDVTAEREADRLKDEFFALVSHELRTPLTSVIGYLELLRDADDPDDPAAAERATYLKVIERNARRLLRLVGDLLFVAQIEAGRLALDLSGRVDVAAVARQSLEAARPRAADAGVRLVDDVEDAGEVRGDADRLAQAVDNLVSNAVKFTPAGGTVTVRVRRDGDGALVEVADTGMGIASEDQERLFERFFRADAVMTAAIQGVGLGLTIVRAIVEGHGGSIGVDSTPGRGATFRVRLPLAPPTNGRPAAMAPDALAAGPGDRA
jgi:signal transduction histidine kinase/CHASE3 domain sensor protein